MRQPQSPSVCMLLPAACCLPSAAIDMSETMTTAMISINWSAHQVENGNKEMLRVDCIHRQKRRTSWFANYNRTLKFTSLDSSGNLSMNTKHWKTTRRIDQWHLPTLHYIIIIWSSINHRHLHHLGIITTTIQLHIQLHVIVIIM